MADERKNDDAEELDIAPAEREEDQNRDRGRQSNDMPREDADQDAQVRQSGDGNVHLGSQRDPDATTTEARRTSTFDNQDTLGAVSRDAARGDGVAEGEAGEDVGFEAEIARDERAGSDGDDGDNRGNDGARAERGNQAGGASETARAAAPGQTGGGNQPGENGPASGNLNPLGRGGRGRGRADQQSAETEGTKTADPTEADDASGETPETDTRDRSDKVVDTELSDDALTGGTGDGSTDGLTADEPRARREPETAEDAGSDERPARGPRSDRIGEPGRGAENNAGVEGGSSGF